MKIRKKWIWIALLVVVCLLMWSNRAAETDGSASSAVEQLVLLPQESSNPALPQEQPAEAAALSEENGTPAPEASQEAVKQLDEHGIYDSKEDVALFLHLYGHLPDNYITKSKAQKLGWSGGSLEPYAPGMCIGGGGFGNNEGLLPKGNYRECDIDTLGASSRGAKRIVWSDDGRIYYTDDHYESFELLYGGTP